MKKKTTRSMPALLIVDVQKGFPVPKKIVKGIERYSQQFQKRILTRFVNRPGSLFEEHLGQQSCAPGSDDLHFLLTTKPGDIIIEKSSYGLSPRDVRRLKAADIKEAVVCGVDTDACVLAVMFSLFDAGIVCHVKDDLCWSSTGLHKAGLKIMEKQFAPSR